MRSIHSRGTDYHVSSLWKSSPLSRYFILDILKGKVEADSSLESAVVSTFPFGNASQHGSTDINLWRISRHGT